MMDDSAPGVLPPDGVELPILKQWSRPFSHENRAMRLAIRNPRDLSQIPLEDFDVNFEEEMLLVVTLGRVYSDQYQIHFDGIRRDRGQLIADVTVVNPPEGAPLKIASPYAVAIIPQCDLPIQGFTNRPPLRSRSWSQSELPR